jgi:hypothetical protein
MHVIADDQRGNARAANGRHFVGMASNTGPSAPPVMAKTPNTAANRTTRPIIGNIYVLCWKSPPAFRPRDGTGAQGNHFM